MFQKELLLKLKVEDIRNLKSEYCCYSAVPQLFFVVVHALVGHISHS